MADREISRYGVESCKTLWRLSRRKYQAMNLPPRKAQGFGRFDDPALQVAYSEGEYGVLYLATDPKSAFMEALAGLRSNLKSRQSVLQGAIMDINDRNEFESESRGSASVVSTEWQDDWQLTGATITTMAPVFDLTDAAAVQFVRDRLAITLVSMGLTDLDFGHLLSDNRDLTRAISRWIWSLESEEGSPLFSGIRYRSRFDPECICIALYENRYTVDGDIGTQSISPETPGFAEAASALRLTTA